MTSSQVSPVEQRTAEPSHTVEFLERKLRYAAWFVLTLGCLCVLGSTLSALAALDVGIHLGEDEAARRQSALHCVRLALEAACHFAAFAFARRRPANAMGTALVVYVLSWISKGFVEPRLLMLGALWHGVVVAVMVVAFLRARALEREIERRTQRRGVR